MARVDLGERIATLREERALTQAELAEKAGISPSTLSLIESGHVTRPHVGTVRKIARALGIEPEDLRRVEELAAPKAGATPALQPSFNELFLEERRIGINYGACRDALNAICDKWQPILQDAVRLDRLDRDTFREFEAWASGLTPFIDGVVQAEITELGQQYDEDGDAVFYSERSELWPALGRFYDIGLGFNKLAKRLGVDSADVVPKDKMDKLRKQRLTGAKAS
jgi:transcriptional regulator with XRE-family HTH domain